MSAVRHSHYESDDGLKLYYADYGATEASCTVVCLPGLTRNSRDYESLAQHLAARYRVIAPDLRGRGRSSWDSKYLNYHPRTYARDVARLLALLAPRNLVLIGTSLGGLVAALLARDGLAALRAVVLNDIGPELDPAGIARIAGYVGATGPFDDWSAATEIVRRNNEYALPDLSGTQWQRFTRALCRTTTDGHIVFDYDPAIGQAFREGAGGPLDLWQAFDGLATVPTLLLRGANSDILSRATVERMQQRLRRLTVVEVSGRGHAPLLDEPESLDAIDRLLLSFGHG
ncbi:MAG: alpha/beta hydrolase [Steroidobacteraceae bacterium]|nr:alpha/beta hydrolase [Steroidobacteraceae bacterium]